MASLAASLCGEIIGETAILRVLQSRTKELWELQHDCEITDVEAGYFMVWFSDNTEYYHVLEHGPWIILGHYLMVSKWKSNFRQE